MKLITTMVAIVIVVPLLFVKLARDYPQSFLFRYFIWIVIVAFILVFISAIGGKKNV